MLYLLALLAFIAATIWFLRDREWPMALVAGGLALWVATGAPIHLG